MSQITRTGSLTGVVKTFNPSTGDDVNPDALGVINLDGSDDISVTGDSVTETITFALTGTTEHAVQVGDATGGIDSLAVGTDGQVLISATGAAPAFATLTSTDGTVTFTTGANSLDLSATSANAPQQQIYYVGKHGNDANSGLNIEQAVLTFGQAITLATAAVPSAVNRFSITCLDDGIYDEAITVPQYVDIFAQSATLTGTLIVNDDSTIKFSRLNVADATIGVLKTEGTAYTNVDIDYITCLVGGIGAIGLSGFINITWKELYVANGFGIGDASSTMAHMHIKGGDIYITGTGVGIARANSGSTLGRVDHIADIGAGVGTGILVLDGTVAINVNTLDSDTAYNVSGATSVLRIFANTITGTRTVALGGTVYPWVTPIAMTDGQLLIGSTGADPVVASLTSTGSTITITPGAGTLNVDTAASVATSYLTDDANSAVPALGVLTVAGGTNIGSTSAGSTVTLNLDAALTGIDSITTNTGGALRTGTTAADTLLLRAYDVDGTAYKTFATLTANNTPTMDLDTDVTIGTKYIYRADGTDIPVADGGTGASTLTDHGVLVGSGTSPVDALAVGATGQGLMGNTAADPSWTGSPSYSGTVTGGTGLTATTGDVTVTAGNVLLPTTTSAVGQLQINGVRFAHAQGTDNTFIGSEAGNFTLSGSQNAGLGRIALVSVTSGVYNTGIGFAAVQSCNTGSNNTGIGGQVLPRMTSGSYNIALGSNGSTTNRVGYNYTGSESSNILIQNTGVNGESNKMRLGTDGTGNGQVDTVYLAGTNANISTVASAGTVNIATGNAAKTVTVGSTNTTSKLDLKYGTSDFTLASATGTVISALDTGEVTMPLQPAFLARRSANIANVTGDGTNYVVICDTEIYDQNGDYDNSTGTFTAPVTGRYCLSWNVGTYNMGAAHNSIIQSILTSNRGYTGYNIYGSNGYSQGGYCSTVLADMDAGDTATFKMYVGGSTKVVGVTGTDPFAGTMASHCSGFLAC